MNKQKTISIQTVGCKLNQAEAETLAREFAGQGAIVTAGKIADIFVINTCSVTQAADSKSRHIVRMLRKQNPGALIVVTGCYAEHASAIIKNCGADMVFGNKDKMSIPVILKGTTGSGSNDNPVIRIEHADRTRSFIKVQDGCRNHCTYCVVPILRRDVVSVERSKVIAEIKDRVTEGRREVVLTGTEIGSYKHDGLNLEDLIKLVLSATSIDRLHLSSLQPQEINAGLLSLWKNPRMVKHFHMSLQSGSEQVLQKMQRCYTTSSYFDAVKKIRSVLPDASITTDVIVGFPGETDRFFRDSYEFCRRMKFAAIHVFAYSRRPGTLAATMHEQVDDKVKKERSLHMLELAAQSAEGFAKNFIDQTRPVLWENEIKLGTGVYLGLTDNYIRVYTSSKKNICNSVVPARLLSTVDDTEGIPLRLTTKGNYGELWSELNEN